MMVMCWRCKARVPEGLATPIFITGFWSGVGPEPPKTPAHICPECDKGYEDPRDVLKRLAKDEAERN